MALSILMSPNKKAKRETLEKIEFRLSHLNGKKIVKNQVISEF